jgi:hypothetical protein
MTHMDSPAKVHAWCPWCGRSFAAGGRGGRERRFCSTRCRQTFHSAARLWAIALVEGGLLSHDALRSWYVARMAAPPTCTAPQGEALDADAR